jgi:hypothetical protein
MKETILQTPMGINTKLKSRSSLDNVAKTIPSRSHSRVRATLINILIRRTTTSRIGRRMAVRVTMLSASHRLSDTKTLLRTSEGVVSRSGRDLGNTMAWILVGARVGELLCKWRALSQDGTFPVDDVDGDHEDEGDAEEDCGSVWEMVFAANVWDLLAFPLKEMGELTVKEWSSGKCQNTCEEITRPSISTGC